MPETEAISGTGRCDWRRAGLALYKPSPSRRRVVFAVLWLNLVGFAAFTVFTGRQLPVTVLCRLSHVTPRQHQTTAETPSVSGVVQVVMLVPFVIASLMLLTVDSPDPPFKAYAAFFEPNAEVYRGASLLRLLLDTRRSSPPSRDCYPSRLS